MSKNTTSFNTINGVTPKEAHTKNERMLLGALAEETKRIGYGTISIEVVVRNGQMDQVVITQVNKRINIGMRDQ